jgi:hypothetical protein
VFKELDNDFSFVNLCPSNHHRIQGVLFDVRIKLEHSSFLCDQPFRGLNQDVTQNDIAITAQRQVGREGSIFFPCSYSDPNRLQGSEGVSAAANDGGCYGSAERGGRRGSATVDIITRVGPISNHSPRVNVNSLAAISRVEPSLGDISLK